MAGQHQKCSRPGNRKQALMQHKDKAAVLYAAKSTQDVRGSIPDQLTACRALAEQEGWTVTAEYSDEAASAYSGDRGPKLAKAIAHAEQLANDHDEAALIVLHSDRIARGDGVHAAHLVEYALWAIKANVKLISVEDRQTFGDLLYAVVTGQRNHEDSHRKSKSVKAGHKRRRKAGRHHGGPAAYGYTYGNGELIPVEAEAAIVRRIFGEYLAGASQMAIAKNFATDRIPTKSGGKWHQGTVRGILANPIYAGMIRDGDDVVPGVHEAIIDMPKWRKVETMRLSLIHI